MTNQRDETSRDWLDTAIQLPVRFAQVREDPLLDMEVLRRAGPNCRALIIASGGCTVCALNSLDPLAEMVVVDPNPAQVELARLKLLIQRDVTASERASLLGHKPMSSEERWTKLTRLASENDIDVQKLGPYSFVGSHGLDFIGRYEMVFGEVSRRLEMNHDEIVNLLMQDDPEKRTRKLENMVDFVYRLRETLNDVMNLSNLVELFGEEATRNRLQDFSDHFFQRIMWAFRQLPTQSNHFLWQVLLGRSPPHHSIPWLRMPLPHRNVQMEFHECSVEDYLFKSEQTFNYIHLSNVLDWLTDEQARSLLSSTWNHLESGGYTLIRQLNSDLNIRGLNDQFEWLIPDAKEMLARDRSFFYRDLHLARKP